MAALTSTELLFRNQRRLLLQRSPTQIGVDWVEVRTGRQPEQWQLHLHFVPADENTPNKVTLPQGLDRRQVRLALAGRPATDVRLEAILEPETATAAGIPDVRPDELILLVRKPRSVGGELPAYTLELAGVPHLDPFFAQADFVFRPGRFGQVIHAPVLPSQEPPIPLQINYLAKDYASFRTLMLNQMSVLMPEWSERNPSDLGVALVEVLAYAGDTLSYYQDAVATEAYLETARRRISLRRHTRWLDYFLHDGCIARDCVQVQVGPNADGVELPAGTQFLNASNVPDVLIEGTEDYRLALAQNPQVFESMHDQRFFAEHNAEIEIYTWGAADFALIRGTHRAALAGHFPRLAAGDVLIFEEQRGASTGKEADADPNHRHAVRLCQPPHLSYDPLGQNPQGAAGPGYPITEIEWFIEDALPFDLQVSTEIGNRTIRPITVVWANLVLADHGRTILVEDLPLVTENRRFAPVLELPDLTYAEPFDASRMRHQPAKGVLLQDPQRALPQLLLYQYSAHSTIPKEEQKPPRGSLWQPQRDLLASGRFARDFVVETDSDRSRHLRFDQRPDSQPAPGSRFKARCRLGNGASGNMGVDAITKIGLGPAVARALAAQGVQLFGACNIMTAEGGTEPEPAGRARINAPPQIRRQQRCITCPDYIEMACRHPEVLHAAAEIRWTGSWETAYVYVQRAAGTPADASFLHQIHAWITPTVVAGYELQVRAPRWVPLNIGLRIVVQSGYFREVVHQKLSSMFSSKKAGDETGFFYPDRFTFGQPVYLSTLVAAAMTVDGVADVDVREFHRWGSPPHDELTRGWIPIGPFEIAMLSNDPNRPQGGELTFTLEGGK